MIAYLFMKAWYYYFEDLKNFSILLVHVVRSVLRSAAIPMKVQVQIQVC